MQGLWMWIGLGLALTEEELHIIILNVVDIAIDWTIYIRAELPMDWSYSQQFKCSCTLSILMTRDPLCPIRN